MNRPSPYGLASNTAGPPGNAGGNTRGDRTPTAPRFPWTRLALALTWPISGVGAEPVGAQSPGGASSEAMGWLDIDQLSQVRVATVTRREQSILDTPAAVTVLSNADLVRSGARNLPEALRQVPGLMVAQIDANSWAVSARGFNSEFANKMLVMIDGRSVYSPLFSGTFWDVQNVMLEDVDRVEVIRGPGAAQWGANAVNGVINIVSKHARDTQGALLYAGGGSPQLALAGARYGGQIGSRTFYRVYGSYQLSDAYPLAATGEPGSDGWNLSQGGFRLDHETAGGTALTWQGDGYYGDMQEGAESACGANTLGRYHHDISDTSNLELTAYYDYAYRSTFVFESPRQMVDLDFQHSFAWGERQHWMWGVGYRVSHSDQVAATPLVTVYQDTLTTQLFSGFLQDEIALVPDHLALSLGGKIEHNEITGWELQPSARLSYRPSDQQLLWAAISRAVRTPGEGEGYVLFSFPAFTPLGPGVYTGNPEAEAEVLLAYEAGYRAQLTRQLSLDFAAYFNDYDEILLQAPTGEVVPPGWQELTSQNLVTGQIYGGELSLTYRPVEFCRLTAWYGFCLSDLDGPPVAEAETVRQEARIPTHQAFLRASFDVARHWTFDAQVRYVDNVETSPAYVEADVRLAYRPVEQLEIALVGQNLVHDKHPEFRQATTAAHAEVPRGVYGKVTWRF